MTRWMQYLRRWLTPKQRLRSQRPRLEVLEDRNAPAVDVTGFDLAVGTVTFTGDDVGDALVLGEVQVVGQRFLSHNLRGNLGTQQYASSLDVDPGPGIATLQLGSGTAPRITVQLQGGSDSLELDGQTWQFLHPITLDGGSGTDSLLAPDTANTFAATGNHTGTLNATAVAWSSIESLRGGTDVDTLVGQDVASAWTLAAANTYHNGSVGLTFDRFEVLQGGGGSDLFDLVGTAAGEALGALRGGAGQDTFKIREGVALTGSIDGQGDPDTLDYSARTTAVAVNLGTATATDVSGPVAGIEGLLGGSNNDSLAGSGGDETLNGGTGNDTLVGGAGNDTYQVGSGTDTLSDSAGSDTLDFSAAPAGVVIDLDLLNAVQAIAAGLGVQLNGPAGGPSPFENFRGSAFNDLIRVAFLAVPRLIEGGPHTVTPPGDTLDLNAAGLAVTTNPTTLTAPALGVIGYASIETIASAPALAPPAGGSAAPARGIAASLMVKKVGKKKKLSIRITFADTGELKRELSSPLQKPAYKGITVSTKDTNGDGAADSVVVRGKKGKKLKEQTIAG